MRARSNTSEYAGSRKGNPDSRTCSNDLWRRPSTESEPVATSRGSVRNDRCNKSRSPKANAPSATRASRLSAPFVKRRGRAEARRRRRGCPAKGRVSGRGFGRRRTLVANGSRLRRKDVQNYPMGSGRALTKGRDPGPRSGDAGSDRTRKASSSPSRKTRRRLMDCDPARRVAIPF